MLRPYKGKHQGGVKGARLGSRPLQRRIQRRRRIQEQLPRVAPPALAESLATVPSPAGWAKLCRTSGADFSIEEDSGRRGYGFGFVAAGRG
jgi:hypothetical protein